MKIMNYKIYFFILLILFLVSIPACSSYHDNDKKMSFEDKMLINYIDNKREKDFYYLKEKYNSKLILFLNKEKNRGWIINTVAWAASTIIDLPRVVAAGGVYGVIVAIAWFLGVALTGGGILAVLAFLGGAFGGIPAIPPAIAGIIYLGVLFSIITTIIQTLMG